MAVEFFNKKDKISNDILNQLVKIDGNVMDFPWNHEQWTDFLKTDLDWMIVIDQDREQIKGFALFQLSSDNWSHLLKIGVSDTFKRKGIASSIMVASLSVLSKDYKSCSLEVRKDNLAAIGLYQRYSFNISHEISRYYSDGSDALKMIAELCQ